MLLIVLYKNIIYFIGDLLGRMQFSLRRGRERKNGVNGEGKGGGGGNISLPISSRPKSEKGTRPH